MTSPPGKFWNGVRSLEKSLLRKYMNGERQTEKGIQSLFVFARTVFVCFQSRRKSAQQTDHCHAKSAEMLPHSPWFMRIDQEAEIRTEPKVSYSIYAARFVCVVVLFWKIKRMNKKKQRKSAYVVFLASVQEVSCAFSCIGWLRKIFALGFFA